MKRLTEEQSKRIHSYLALDEDELYSQIPVHLPEYDSTLFAPMGQIEAGKAFFERILGDLKKAVCEDFDWPSKRDDSKFTDTVALVATIADAIAGYVRTVPPFMIAVLLVKIGLDNLCGCYSQESPSVVETPTT